MDKTQTPSYETLLSTLQRFCAYQERCTGDLQRKLYELGVNPDQAVKLIEEASNRGWFNDELFASVYARSKLRQKHWGKNKIRMYLQQKRLSKVLIEKALNEIDLDEYTEVLSKITDKYDVPKSYSAKQKLAKKLYDKGYESDLIWKAINQLAEKT